MKTWNVVRIIEGQPKGIPIIFCLTYFEAKLMVNTLNETGFQYDMAKAV